MTGAQLGFRAACVYAHLSEGCAAIRHDGRILGIKCRCQGEVGCGPNLPSDVCSARRSCSVPALQCHMSIYTLHHAPIGTCTADAWGAGMEVREACGLLTSFLIFRMSLYFPHAARYLPKAHESQNQHICLPPDLSHTCFKSLHKVEIYFLEFAERFWSSAFSYMQPLPHPLGAGGALALSEDTHPSPTSFPLLLPDERTRSAQYRAFCSCIQEQDFDDYKLDKSFKSSLLKR